jgi:hypothetical protein
MYASKIAGRERTPEWERLYAERLAELTEKTHWEAIERAAIASGLTPDQVKFAIDFAYSDPLKVDEFNEMAKRA